MFPNDPRAAIALLPYLLDEAPREVLLIAGFDADGTLVQRGAFRIDVPRPLDEPLLDSSLWNEDVRFAAAVLYSAEETLDLRPLADAWGYRGRTTLTAAWAGPTRWRSQLCTTRGCCASDSHAYKARLRDHETFDPLADQSQPITAWRRARWDDWTAAMRHAAHGGVSDPMQLERLSRSLHDIPIRDAVLAHSVRADVPAHPVLRRLLGEMMRRSTIGAGVPAATCLAAMLYLEDEFDAAQALVDDVLSAEEYSLASLLHNGLQMRAPASLLARSFASFTPQQLLAA